MNAALAGSPASAGSSHGRLVALGAKDFDAGAEIAGTTNNNDAAIAGFTKTFA